MDNMIKLQDLLGGEIRSRSSADTLRSHIKDYDNLIIDMSGVSFISRSFADELCVLAEGHAIQLRNASGIVQNMLSAVSESRHKKRVRKTDNAEIKEFDDMKSLSAFLATI